MKWIVTLLGACITIFSTICLGQRIPPPPQNFLNNLNNPPQQPLPPQQQNISSGLNIQVIQQQQQNDELANIKDENIKRVLLELSTLQTPSQMSETMARVAQLVGPLFISNFDGRKDQIVAQGRDASSFPQRLLSAVTDIQGEEVKALVLQKRLELLHAGDFAFLPLAIQYGLQEEILRNLSGTKLASVVKANPGDTVIAFKVSTSLKDRSDQQLEFLQSLGTKLLPEVQRIIMRQLLQWWGDPHNWKDRELTLLTSAGNPLLAFMPQSDLESLDDELADRFVTTLGQTQDIARGWWRKPMSLKKAWFELAKGARYFGAVHEWSFRRMQKLSFLLEGASPEDLELIPPVPEIKSLVIGNHYTELQARIVFDAFYHTAPLSQEDLQEFQFHLLDLTPSQVQRFDFADSFGTLDEMMSILERQTQPSYPTILQISYFMWPIVNSTSNSAMSIAPAAIWQKRELSQIGKMFFLLPKSILMQMKPDIINWDSNILASIRSNHLSTFQVWRLTAQILQTVDERFRPDYIFMIPSPFQKGIPTQNISQALLGTTSVRPEILRALIEETSGMLTSQKAVILQRIINRISEAIVIRTMISTQDPAEMFNLISPKVLNKNMATIIKTIMEMPETGRFGITSVQTKLLPHITLSLWLKWVRENAQVTRWTAEDLLGRSPMGATHELDLAILGLSCRDIDIVDSWDVLSVIMHYRHELYGLRRFKPTLTFNVNLRPCVLLKFVEYLKQKRFLNGDQADGHVLSEITMGEIEAIGGEILSLVPTQALDHLQIETRQNIIKEIGQLQMLELFSLISLQDLHWYGTTLFRDIEITSGTPNTPRNRRQTDSTPTGTTTATDATNATSPDPAIDGGNGSDTQTPFAPATATSIPATPSSTPKGVNLEALHKMGNLICYADNLFDSNWPRTLLKDVLEGKTSVGEKTCCLSKILRDKWFEALKTAYGSDTSSWNEFDLSAIGDLLIALPEQDLQKISLDSLGKAVTPMMRQSAFDIKIAIPGHVKRIQFATACTDALGTEGLEFNSAFKKLMKRIFQASQWNVNTVKTTQELIRDGVGRTGRIPRWAEHTLVKRQVPISTGGELAYTGSGSGYTPSPLNNPTISATPSSSYYPAVTGGDAYSNQNARQSMYPASSASYSGVTNTQPLGSYSPQQQQSNVGYGNQGQLSPQPISNMPAQAGTGYGQSTYSSPQQNYNPMQSSASYSPQYTPPAQSVNTYNPQPLSSPQQQQQQQQLPATTSQYSPAYSSPQTQAIGNNPSQPLGGYSPQSTAGYGSPASSLISPQTPANPLQLSTSSYTPQPVNAYPQNMASYTPQASSNIQSQPTIGGTSNSQQYTSSYYPQNQGSYTTSNQYLNQPQQQLPSQPISSFGTQPTGATGTGAFVTGAGTAGAGAFGAAGSGAFGAAGSGSFGVAGTGSTASTAAGGSFAQGNANANSAGGSFAQSNTFAGNNVGNANAFGGSGANAQASDILQSGSFSQTNAGANANTFATRGLGNQQQPGVNANMNQQQQPGVNANMNQQQQPGANANMNQQQQPGVNANMNQQQQQQGASFNMNQQQQGSSFNMNQQQQGMPFNQQQGGNNMGFQQGGINLQQQQQGVGGQQIPGSLPSQQAGGINQQQGIGSLQQQGGAITGSSATANSAIAGRAGGGGGDATSSTVVGSTGTANDRTRSLDFGTAQDEAHNSEITCHGIKAAGPAAIGLGIDDLNKLTQTDLFDCVEALGNIEWDDETKGQILSLLKQKLEFNKDSINALTLIEMGDLVTAFNTKSQGSSVSDGFSSSNITSSENITIHSDVSMIDFTLPLSLDILSILGQQIVNPDLLKALAEKFNQDNRIFPGFSEGIARPENLRIVVMSLGNVICGLTDKIVNSIFETDPSLFIDTSRILGRLEGCSNDVLSTLAAHAVRPSNYGPPRLWSQEDVETVGVVFAGLKPDAITTIPADAMQGLTPLAIKNLPPTGLLSFTTDQLSKMSFSAAMALTPSQLNNLTPAELEAVRAVLQVQSELFNVPVVADDQANQDVVARGISTGDANITDINSRSRADMEPTTPAPEMEGTDAEDDSMITTEQTTTTPAPTLVTEPVPKSSSSKFTAPFSMYLSLIVCIIPVLLV